MTTLLNLVNSMISLTLSNMVAEDKDLILEIGASLNNIYERPMDLSLEMGSLPKKLENIDRALNKLEAYNLPLSVLLEPTEEELEILDYYVAP